MNVSTIGTTLKQDVIDAITDQDKAALGVIGAYQKAGAALALEDFDFKDKDELKKLKAMIDPTLKARGIAKSSETAKRAEAATCIKHHDLVDEATKRADSSRATAKSAKLEVKNRQQVILSSIRFMAKDKDATQAGFNTAQGVSATAIRAKSDETERKVNFTIGQKLAEQFFRFRGKDEYDQAVIEAAILAVSAIVKTDIDEDLEAVAAGQVKVDGATTVVAMDEFMSTMSKPVRARIILPKFNKDGSKSKRQPVRGA